MNFKKSLVALASVAAMGVSVVGAANIGAVNIAEVYNNYPHIQEIRQKIQIISQKYEPQLAQVGEKINKEQNEEARTAIYNNEYMPIQKKVNDEVVKVMGPVDKAIADAMEKFRANQKLDLIVLYPPQPTNLIFGPDNKVVDFTKELVEAVKK